MTGYDPQIPSTLTRLWQKPKARRLLARLVLGVKFGGETGRTPDDYFRQKPFPQMVWGMDNLMKSTRFPFGARIGIGDRSDNNYSQNLRNFAIRASDRFSDPARANTVAFYLTHLFANDARYYSLGMVRDALQECNIIALFRNIVGDGYLPPADEEAPPDIEALWAALGSYLSISSALMAAFAIESGHIDEANNRFLRQVGGSYCNEHFLCYRYASRPGFIVKSFLTLTPPVGDGALSTFTHHYADRHGNQRWADGIWCRFRGRYTS